MFKVCGAAVGAQGHGMTQMSCTEASISPEIIPFQRLRRLKQMLRAETEHEGLATSCVPSTERRPYHSSLQSPGRGDGHSRHSCRLVSSLGMIAYSE